MFDYTQALISLYPNCHWEHHGYEYDGLIWHDTNITKPSKEELDAERVRLQAEYDSKEYQRKRATEYPPIVDQLDTIFHGGLEAWQAQIQAVKNKYPKPE